MQWRNATCVCARYGIHGTYILNSYVEKVGKDKSCNVRLKQVVLRSQRYDIDIKSR